MSTPQKQYRLSIRRPVTVAMIFLTLLVFGWKSYEELPLNLMPDISYPTLTVRTEYEGAAPEDVAELVTKPLEERLSVVSNVVEITSVSSAGRSEIILEFTWGTDMDTAMQDVREGLDTFTPPQGVTRRPVILRFDPTLDPVMRVAILGHAPEEVSDPLQLEDELTVIREATDRQLKNDLEAEVGIAQVVVRGGREQEVQISVDSERLKTLGMTLANIVTSLEQQNINFSGGRLKEGKTEYLVRTLNEFQNVREIRDVLVNAPSGLQLRLSDIAQVRLGEKDLETIVRVNGQEAVELEIFKEGSANTVEVCDTLKDFFGFEREQSTYEKFMLAASEHMPEEQREAFLKEQERKERVADKLRSRLPDYAQPALITDQSRFIEASVNEVRQTAIIGGLFALGILFLFLKELRSTVIIGVAIPISVIATFIPMFIQNVSLNIMSLGGLALGVGMLVDNSIVVLESIFRCKEEGDDIIDAAERGTSEVASAVTASTLTTIAVFAPIIFVSGIAGQMFRDLALTVTFSLLASLLVALYLIPMIASRRGRLSQEGPGTVWTLRAYRMGRVDGKSRFGAILAVPMNGLRLARGGITASWREAVAPLLLTARGRSEDPHHQGRAARLNAVVLLPFVILLFALQLLLRSAAVAIVTALFTIAAGIVAVVGVCAFLFMKVLSVPIRVFDRFFLAIRGLYSVTLRHALHFSPLILIGVVALAVHAVGRAGDLGRELIPPMKQGEFSIRLEAPPGTRLEDTERRARAIEDVVRESPYVETVTVEAGQESDSAGEDEGENVAILTVKLENPKETVQYQDRLIDEIRNEIAHISSDQISFVLPTLFSFKTAIELHIFGDNTEELRRLSERTKTQVASISGIKDVESSLRKGYPEVHITVDRVLLSEQGLTPMEVGNQLRTEVEGDIATQFNRRGEKIPIRVRAEQERLESVDDLRMLSVRGSSPPLPLNQVASITERAGPSEIRRIDQRQVAVITANVEGRDLGSAARDIEHTLAAKTWPEGYTFSLGGQQRELETSYGGLIFALAMAVFLVYVVMACQFESMWHPALIMFSVPLAFIGVVYVLEAFGINVSVVVFIGGIVLAGIVVNAAIVLVDYINQLRHRGLSKVDAIVRAGEVRFRPIIMTTMTTVLGLIPMAMSTGEGAEIRQPMAITVMAGLCSGTILTLFIIPVLYYFATPGDKRSGADTAAST